jgi:hypothetical protein
LTSLQLIMHSRTMQYLFTDFAKGDSFRQTGIQVHSDGRGTRFLEDNDVKRFLRSELGSSDLPVFLTGRPNPWTYARRR